MKNTTTAAKAATHPTATATARRAHDGSIGASVAWMALLTGLAGGCWTQRLDAGEFTGPGPGPESAPTSPKTLGSVPNAWGVAVDATTVYVASQGSPGRPLFAVPINGGDSTPLSADSNYTVAIDEDCVYWSDGTSVFACAKQNCPSSTVALATSSNGGVYGLAVDDASVYWGTTTGDAVMKVDKFGGTPVVLASSRYPYQLVVDATNVYWTGTDPLGHGTVMKVPKTGGVPVQLAIEADAGTYGVAVSGDKVYFLTGAGKIMRVSTDGSDPRTLSTALGNSPWGIATDGKNVYAGGASGAVVKVPVDGGPLKVIASGQGFVAGIAVDSTCVYWAALNAGEVRKVAK